MLNFSDKEAVAGVGLDLLKAPILIHNYPEPRRGNKLRPYEAVVYKMKGK